MISLLLFALLGSSNVTAASLTGEVDLRSFYPEIRNQQNVGNCYAQTASDLETAYYRERGEKRDRFVSPDAISVCTKAEILNVNFEQAKRIRALTQTKNFQANKIKLKSLVKEWEHFSFPHDPPTPADLINEKYTVLQKQITLLCKNLFYPSDSKCLREFLANSQSKSQPLTPEEAGTSVDNSGILEAIQQSNQRCGVCFQKSFSANDNLLIYQFDRQIEQYSHDSELSSFEACSENSVLAGGNLRTLKKIVQKLKQENLTEHPALLLFEKKCHKDRHAQYFLEHAHQENISSDKTLELEHLSDLLDQKIPFGVTYESSILSGAEPYPTANHASSVVGKRMIGGKLYFILRNSWGKNECEIRRTQITNPVFSCDQGDFLVEAMSLIQVTESITYFQ